MIILTILSTFQGYESYRNDLNAYSAWTSHHRSNVELVERLRHMVDFKCATFASNMNVRGYANLLVGRSIYEFQTLDQAIELNEERKGCASVFLEGHIVFVDLPRYTKAIVTKSNGHQFVLVDESFFVTDENWVRGIARRWAGFFVYNSTENHEKFREGNTVVFRNGERRRITSVVESGPYLNVWIDGDILVPEEVGLPDRFEVLQGE